MTTISVVIPCFNAGAFLAEALASVVAQTRPVHEIILVDDGSTDDSVAVAARYPVTVLRTGSNAGPSGARNMGIARATGDVIAFLDADDWWLPEHCEVVVGMLDRFPEAGVAGGSARYVGARHGVFTPLFEQGRPVDVFRKALRYCPMPQMASAVRRELLLTVGGYDRAHRGTEDFDLWLRLSRLTRFVCTHQVTACYRWHAGQISSKPLHFVKGMFLSRHSLHDALIKEGNLQGAGLVRREIWLRWAIELWQALRARDREWLETAWELRADVPLRAA